jgi:hypothetical protein
MTVVVLMGTRTAAVVAIKTAMAAKKKIRLK